jgi:glyoxylase-like metal-dependent hydrolase (beta-lactamase superfamily II)
LPQVREVIGRIYAYIQPDGTWWINNTGFLVGPRGVISVDSSSTQPRTRAYLDAIAAVTTAPVRTLVNIHHHGDHTFGNCMFPGAAIIAHECVRAEAIGLMASAGGGLSLTSASTSASTAVRSRSGTTAGTRAACAQWCAVG